MATVVATHRTPAMRRSAYTLDIPLLEVVSVAKYQHVVPRDGKWVVKGDGSQRVSRVLATRDEAIDVARRIARNQGADVVIHGPDGTRCETDSYGTDPFPPRNGTR